MNYIQTNKLLQMSYPLKYILSSLISFCLLLIFTSFIYGSTIGNPIELYSLNTSVAHSSSILIDDKLYVINGSGSTGNTDSNIWETTILTNGDIENNWRSIQNLNPPLIYSTSTNNNIYAYILGGYEDTVNTVDSVYYSVYDGNSLNSFTTTMGLPQSSALGAAVIDNNHIYYMGGFTGNDAGNGNTYSDKVYMSTISSSGQLGSWEDDGATDLPTPLTRFGAVNTNQKIAIIGGRSNNEKYSDSIYEADINSDGTLGNWILSPNHLPKKVNRSFVAKIQNTIVVAGGNIKGISGNENNSEIYYADIDSSGSVGSWNTSEYFLPIRLCCGATSSSNTNVYLIGGYSQDVSGHYTQRVFRLPLEDDKLLLDVYDFKQYSDPWGTEEYDFASSWYPNNPTIARWGCALTSAAMVLDFHGHNVDPQMLNNWLKSQPDGYTPNGGVMWTAISRYTKLHESETSPTLEFTYLPYSEQTLSDEMSADEPRAPIVKFQKPNGNTHFLVTKGKDENDYLINDPASTRETLTEAENYWGTPVKIGKFLPVTSDLSYIVLFVDNNFDINVTNPDGIDITDDYLTEEGPIVAADDPSVNSGETLKAFYYPKPEDGMYDVNISGDGDFQLDSYLYDELGNPVIQNIKLNVSDGESKTLLIDYTNDNPLLLDPKYEYLYKYLLEKRNEADLLHKGIYNFLLNHMVNANKHSLMDQTKIENKLIEDMKTQVQQFEELGLIDFDEQLNTLLNSL
jgi:N-acetylneuraminic acid mutarotase